MAKIELVIFDCDGVLIDSERLSCECAAEALRALGVDIDTETVMKRFVGRARHDMMRDIRNDGYTVPSDFPQKLEKAVTEAFETRLKPIPGVKEALKQIETKRCVASGSPVFYLEHGLKLTGLFDFFGKNMFSAAMVAHGKPAPDLFLHAAGQMGVAPGNCLVIEDSILGIQAANAAKMPVFCFAGGSHIDLEKRPFDFTLGQPDLIFKSMLELPKLIEKFSTK